MWFLRKTPPNLSARRSFIGPPENESADAFPVHLTARFVAARECLSVGPHLHQEFNAGSGKIGHHCFAYGILIP
jgi:hypothetical protein